MRTKYVGQECYHMYSGNGYTVTQKGFCDGSLVETKYLGQKFYPADSCEEYALMKSLQDRHAMWKKYQLDTSME